MPAPRAAEERGPATGPAPAAVLRVREAVLFPGGLLPLALATPQSVLLIQDAVKEEALVGVFTQRPYAERHPNASPLFRVGTLAHVVKVRKAGETDYGLMLQGVARVRILEFVQVLPYLKGHLERVPSKPTANDVGVEALAASLKRLSVEFMAALPELPAGTSELVSATEHPGHLANLVTAAIHPPLEEQQLVLETLDVKERLLVVLALLARQWQRWELAKEIAFPVRGLTQGTGERFVRGQLEAIHAALVGAKATEVRRAAQTAHRPGQGILGLAVALLSVLLRTLRAGLNRLRLYAGSVWP